MAGETAGGGRRPDLADGAALVAILAAVLYFAWPLPSGLGSMLPGHQGHSGLQGALFFEWNIQRKLAEGRLPGWFGSPWVALPEGLPFETKVVFSGFLLLFMLLSVPLDLVPAHNATVLVALVLGAGCAFALLRERCRSAAWALAGALLFGIGPYVALKLEQGFIHKATLFPLPLAVLLGLRLLERPSARTAAGFLALLGLTGLVYLPFAGFLLLMLAPVAVSILVRRLGWGRVRAPLLGAAGLLLVLLLAAAGSLHTGHAWPGSMDLGAGAYRLEGGYLEPLRFYRWHPYLEVPPGVPEAFVASLTLGLPVLAGALACLAAWRGVGLARAWLLAAALLLLLMAGPVLLDGGEPVRLGRWEVALPLRLVAAMPLGAVFRMPIRMLPFVQLALLLAAGELFVPGRGGRVAWRGLRGLAALLGAVVLIETWLLFPEYRHLRVEPVRTPEFCAAEAGDGDAVLHYPWNPTRFHAYVFFAALCDRPMVNNDLWRPPHLMLPQASDGEDVKLRFLESLSAMGVGWVLVHQDEYAARSQAPDDHGLPSDAGVETWLGELCGPPRRYPGDALLAWRLDPETGCHAPGDPASP